LLLAILIVGATFSAAASLRVGVSGNVTVFYRDDSTERPLTRGGHMITTYPFYGVPETAVRLDALDPLDAQRPVVARTTRITRDLNAMLDWAIMQPVLGGISYVCFLWLTPTLALWWRARAFPTTQRLSIRTATLYWSRIIVVVAWSAVMAAVLDLAVRVWLLTPDSKYQAAQSVIRSIPAFVAFVLWVAALRCDQTDRLLPGPYSRGTFAALVVVTPVAIASLVLEYAG
jgi:hypothetical protein